MQLWSFSLMKIFKIQKSLLDRTDWSLNELWTAKEGYEDEEWSGVQSVWRTAETGGGLDDPYGSLPIGDILWISYAKLKWK